MRAPPPDPVPPPAGLSDRSCELWRQIVPAVISPSRAALLEEALRVRDRLQEVRAILATENLTVMTERTKAVHVHPLLKVETELRRQFASIWGQLSLQYRGEIDGSLANLKGFAL